jgi:hypothetical protein
MECEMTSRVPVAQLAEGFFGDCQMTSMKY